jgi:DNA-3-methyladenine glycosylase
VGGILVEREFFDRPALQVAPDLLGCVLWSGPVAVRLTETEAYHGAADPASHAYRGQTPRNSVMFGPPGHAYVYFTYGMHFCVNLVCLPPGTASAVLLRAGEVVAGVGEAQARRGEKVPLRDLARGPARLCQALGIDRGYNGADVVDRAGLLRLEAGDAAGGSGMVSSGPRVGVREGWREPWRFWLDSDPTVSVYRPHPKIALPLWAAGVAACLP